MAINSLTAVFYLFIYLQLDKGCSEGIRGWFVGFFSPEQSGNAFDVRSAFLTWQLAAYKRIHVHIKGHLLPLFGTLLFL